MLPHHLNMPGPAADRPYHRQRRHTLQGVSSFSGRWHPQTTEVENPAFYRQGSSRPVVGRTSSQLTVAVGRTWTDAEGSRALRCRVQRISGPHEPAAPVAEVAMQDIGAEPAAAAIGAAAIGAAAARGVGGGGLTRKRGCPSGEISPRRIASLTNSHGSGKSPKRSGPGEARREIAAGESSRYTEHCTSEGTGLEGRQSVLQAAAAGLGFAPGQRERVGGVWGGAGAAGAAGAAGFAYSAPGSAAVTPPVAEVDMLMPPPPPPPLVVCHDAAAGGPGLSSSSPSSGGSTPGVGVFPSRYTNQLGAL